MQAVPRRKRVAEANLRQRVALDAAPEQIGAGVLGFRPVEELVGKISRRVLMQLIERVIPPRLLRRRRIRLLFRQIDAEPLRQCLNRFGKAVFFMLHQERERIPALAAAVAMKNLLRRIHHERRRFFFVKRAESLIILAGFF